MKLNGNAVKASKNVNVGEEYEVKTEKKWKKKVVCILHQRMQYSEAIKFYIDLTIVEIIDKSQFSPSSFHTGKRLSKSG